MKIIYFLLPLILFFTSCQDSASSNQTISSCPQNTILKYPLKTGQENIFAYEDITTIPPSFYYDDGYTKKGYDKNFQNLNDGTVYNSNYDLYWQDNEVYEEYNLTVAKNYCRDLNLASNSNWRLPNIYELVSLLNLDGMNNLVDSSFTYMPYGSYYTNNEFINNDKVYVVNFEQNDFYISKIDKEYDANLTISQYGTLVGLVQEPTYGPRTGELIKIEDSTIYYDEIKNLLTTLTYYSRFDENSTLIATDGPFIVQEVPANAPEIKILKKTYIKCVSGKEITNFNFQRDSKQGIVKDTLTNLIWQDTADVVNRKFQWGESVKYCSNLNLAGNDDWRVPTISELLTIVDLKQKGTYAVDNTFLYKSATKFHSSSNLCHGELCAQKNLQLNTCNYMDDLITQNIQVDQNPYDDNKSEPYFRVRCVRCGSD